MSVSELERLFWEEFDGPPSPARRERIEALSRQGSETRRRLDELLALAGELESVEELAPPPELAIEVGRRIASRAAYGAGAGMPLVRWIRQALAAGWEARLAYATIGVLIGLFCTCLVVGGLKPVSESDRTRLSGALNVESRLSSGPLEVALADSAGTLRLFGDGPHLVLALIPGPQETLELSVSRQDGGLEPLRVEEIGASRHELSAGPAAVRLVADGPVSLVLGVGDEGPSTLTVRVSTASGRRVLDRQLDFAELAGGS